MDVYFISILIIGAVIFVKVMIIICIYACRAKRQRQPARQDSSAYPDEPHTQRSAIVNFEETPQPIISVPPGSDPATLNPMLAPPPYSVATQGKNENDKPPTYEQIMQEGEPPPFGVHFGEPATASGVPTERNTGIASNPALAAGYPIGVIELQNPVGGVVMRAGAMETSGGIQVGNTTQAVSCTQSNAEASSHSQS